MEKTTLHASISVLIVFTQAICRRLRQSWKGIHQKVAFERLTTKHLDLQQCQSSTDPKRNKIWFSPISTLALVTSPKKTKFGSLQSSRWISSRRKLLTHTLQPTPIHSTQPPSSPFYPFHSTPLHPRPVTCAAPCPRQSEILRGRRNGVSL